MRTQQGRRLLVGRRMITLTNESKLWFPIDGITKGNVVAYYQTIAPLMVPLIKNHLLVMQRFPEGIESEGFFQKNASDYFPSWIKTVGVPKESGEDVHYVVCNDAATIVYLANQGCLTFHSWLSKADKINYPDRMIFDLDPSDDDFNLVRTTALHFKQMLTFLGLPCFVMTTGSRGLHVIVPLKAVHPFEYVRDFAQNCAMLMAAYDPKNLTIQIRKEKREGRLLVDYFRNAFGQTGVAPYSIRPKPGAPVAMPISWDEVASSSLTPQKYTIKNAAHWAQKRKNPWAQMQQQAVNLKKARGLLDQVVRAYASSF